VVKKVFKLSLNILFVLISSTLVFALLIFLAYADSLTVPGTHIVNEGHLEDCVSSNVITVWYQINSDKPLAGKKLIFTLKKPYSETVYSTTEIVLNENGYVKIDLPKPDCQRGSVELVITLEETKLKHIDRFYLQ
jgi:hypothetical protein